MIEYIHFVPGRLRVKISQLRDRRRAAEAEARVGAVASVKSATVNPVTGSLTITFDENHLSIDDLWETLRAQAYVSESRPESVASDLPFPTGQFGADRFGQAVLAALFEALLQHSARAVARALL